MPPFQTWDWIGCWVEETQLVPLVLVGRQARRIVLMGLLKSSRGAATWLSQLTHFFCTIRGGKTKTFHASHTMVFSRMGRSPGTRYWMPSTSFSRAYKGWVYAYQNGFLYEDDPKFKPALVCHHPFIDRHLQERAHVYDFLAVIGVTRAISGSRALICSRSYSSVHSLSWVSKIFYGSSSAS